MYVRSSYAVDETGADRVPESQNGPRTSVTALQGKVKQGTGSELGELQVHMRRSSGSRVNGCRVERAFQQADGSRIWKAGTVRSVC